MRYKVGDLAKIKNRFTGSLKEFNDEVAQIVAVCNLTGSYLIDLDKVKLYWYDEEFVEDYEPTIKEHYASCRKFGVCFDYDDKGNKIVQDSETIEWKKLCKIAESYMQKYGNPHKTIIITQTGIELSQGEKASPFKVLD